MNQFELLIIALSLTIKQKKNKQKKNLYCIMLLFLTYYSWLEPLSFIDSSVGSLLSYFYVLLVDSMSLSMEFSS